MNAQRQSLYHMEWQALRIQLLGNWHSSPQICQNLVMLNKYIYTACSMDSLDMLMTREYQVVNLLDAVCMGYSGQGHGGGPLDLAVKGGRQIFQNAYRRLTGEGHKFVVPTEEEIREDCRLIGKDLTKKILTDLRKRRDFAIRKSAMPTNELRLRSVQQNRPELLWAINAIETSGVV